LKIQELEFSGTQRLITAGQTESLYLDREEGDAELVGDWEDAVQLSENVTFPPALWEDSTVSNHSTG